MLCVGYFVFTGSEGYQDNYSQGYKLLNLSKQME